MVVRKERRRSACPINASIELLGDRWSLLVIRELLLRGPRSYKQLTELTERIATNVLADRLAKLTVAHVIDAHGDPDDRRRVLYRLTEKGVELAPVLRELAIWGTKYEPSVRPPAAVSELMKQTDGRRFAGEMRRRWAKDEPLLR
jgi:DNA-binding HxlR family transcriptional regulator